MLLILAVLATTITPMSDMEMDSNWQVWSKGRVAWESQNPYAYAVVTVSYDGEPIDEQVIYSSGGDYAVFLGYENTVEDVYTVSCRMIDGAPPYAVLVETLYWDEDFEFQLPAKIWVGIKTFVF